MVRPKMLGVENIGRASLSISNLNWRIQKKKDQGDPVVFDRALLRLKSPNHEF
jgi:hypothetical protein